MRPVLIALITATLAATSTAVLADKLRADHPILGTWKITLPDVKCDEVYRFRADGTAFITSAEEIAESEFEIAAKPSAAGYYKWVDKIVKDNGKKDCSGQITSPGEAATNYLRFHQSGDMFLMCEKEDINTCIGPFVRVRGDRT